MNKKKEQKFSVGERVADEFSNAYGTVLEIQDRGNFWRYRYFYKVKFDRKFLFWKYTTIKISSELGFRKLV